VAGSGNLRVYIRARRRAAGDSLPIFTACGHLRSRKIHWFQGLGPALRRVIQRLPVCLLPRSGGITARSPRLKAFPRNDVHGGAAGHGRAYRWKNSFRVAAQRIFQPEVAGDQLYHSANSEEGASRPADQGAGDIIANTIDQNFHQCHGLVSVAIILVALLSWLLEAVTLKWTACTARL